MSENKETTNKIALWIRVAQIASGIVLIVLAVIGTIYAQETLDIMRWVLSVSLIIIGIVFAILGFLNKDYKEKPRKRMLVIGAGIVLVVLGILPMIFAGIANLMITIIIMLVMIVVGGFRVYAGWTNTEFPRWLTNIYIMNGSVCVTLALVVLITQTQNVGESVIYYMAFLFLITSSGLILDGIVGKEKTDHKDKKKKKKDKKPKEQEKQPEEQEKELKKQEKEPKDRKTESTKKEQ